MKLFSWRFIRLWQRNADVFRRLWHTEAPGFIVEPIIILLAMGVGLGAYVGLVNGQEYISFIVPGVIASYSMYSASFECTYGTFYRMDARHTFDAITATPLEVEDIVAGEIFWGATRALITGTVILVIALFFRLIPSPWSVLVLPVTFLGGIMFAAIAVTVTSLVPSFYSFNYYFTLFINPMFFFSGVFFPLTSFPEIVQRLSLVVPLTSFVNLNRAMILGNFQPELLIYLAIMLGITVVFFAVALITLKRRITS